MGYFRRQQEYPVFADTALQMGGRQSKCPLNLKLPEHVTKAEKGFGVGERDSGFPAIWKERCGWSECFGLRNRPNARAGPPFDDAPMTEETGGRFSNVASLGRQIDRQRGRNQTSAISSYLIRSATRFRWCRCSLSLSRHGFTCAASAGFRVFPGGFLPGGRPFFLPVWPASGSPRTLPSPHWGTNCFLCIRSNICCCALRGRFLSRRPSLGDFCWPV